MPTILRINSFTIRFFSNEEGEPPHVHVDRDGCTAKVWLTPTTSLALSRGYSAHETRLILKMVAENREQCLESWIKYFAGRKR